ncbi:MAG TPA: hypothetical protein VJH20_01695 [Candidatus Nanoarchaeia archaeon]|nr:hypothetical protein [Candidatus Nanoarchaeia archaeon]
MVIYDIIQLDDDEGERYLIKNASERSLLNYLGISSLSSLEKSLKNGDSAKVYIIDGNFPRGESPIEFLAQEAINLIREIYPSSKLFLYSSVEEDLKILSKIQKIAKEKNVDFRNKNRVTHRTLLKEIKGYLENI